MLQNHKRARHESDDGDVVYKGTYHRNPKDPAGCTPSNGETVMIHCEVQPGNRTHRYLCWELKHAVENCSQLRAENAELRRQTGLSPTVSGTTAEKTIERLEADVAYWRNRAEGAENALNKQASQAVLP